MTARLLSLCLLPLAPAVPRAAEGAVPQWIWAPGPAQKSQTAFLSRYVEIPGPIASAWVSGSADDVFRLLINGQTAASGSGADKPVMISVSAHLREGQNWLGVLARNYDGEAGVQLALDLELKDGRTLRWVTDGDWLVSTGKPAQPPPPDHPGPEWQPARVIAPLGGGAWGRLPEPNPPGQATPPSRIRVPPGFAVDLLYSVPAEQGSWVTLCLDGNDRPIVSDQGGALYRLRIPPAGGALRSNDVVRISPPGLTSAQGLLHAFFSLYVVGRMEGVPGVYRLRDIDNDDLYDAVDKVLPLHEVGHEHGAHNLALSPDGKRIFLIAGNLCNPPEKIDHSKVPPVWELDAPLPAIPSANHLFAQARPEGGWIASFDRTGQEVMLEASGLRNPYDLVFTPRGDLVTHESDMEWDIGMPWYRPCRLLHILPGADYGWRHGSANWPAEYEDGMPGFADTGRGSPSGLCMGTGLHFPSEYRDALFIADWTYGRIQVAHLSGKGGSYAASVQDFLAGSPLPVARMVVHRRDGALYFITGGRNTQAGFYRVRWTGKISPPTPHGLDSAGVFPEAELRNRLQNLLPTPGRDRLPTIWPHLGHPDRAVRQAARLALENIPWAEWSEQALNEPEPGKAATALLALARVAEARSGLGPRLREALLKQDGISQADRIKRVLLRARMVAALRHPHPDGYAEGWRSFLPTLDPAVERMVHELRALSGDPGLVAEMMPRLAQATRQVDAIGVANLARATGAGWTPALRRDFFTWLGVAEGRLRDGDWIGGDHARHFLQRMADEVLKNAPLTEVEALKALAARPPDALPPPPPRGFVKAWTPTELLDGETLVSRRRHYDVGRAVYREAGCAACHVLGGAGGVSGPDLSPLAGKFGYRDILRELLQPSAVIPETFAFTSLVLKDGRSFTGRVLEATGGTLRLQPASPPEAPALEIAEADIQSRALSPVSPMPAGLLNRFQREEILDLIAYLLAGGRPDDPAFE